MRNQRGEFKNGKEKQGWQDDGGQGTGCEVGGWEGPRQEPSSGQEDNVHLGREEGQVVADGMTAITRFSILFIGV
jgi:hypothetical protein